MLARQDIVMLQLVAQLGVTRQKFTDAGCVPILRLSAQVNTVLVSCTRWKKVML